MTPTRTRRLLTVTILWAFMALASPAHAATITLLPAATLTAAPGQTVGWGFEFTGDPLLDVYVNASLTPLPVSQGIASLLSPIFVFAGSPMVTEAYDPFALPFPLGLFEIALAPTATPGLLTGTYAGQFDFYDPTLGDFVRSEEFSVPFSINVTAAAAATVPEPSTLILFGAGLGVVVLGRRLRRA